jgi:hypothetical protein
MSINDDVHSQVLNTIEVGELVIMQDGRRAIVEEMKPGEKELRYRVQTRDGVQHEVEAGTLIRAKVYASWVAPGSDWDGEERRRTNRPITELPEGERRRNDVNF